MTEAGEHDKDKREAEHEEGDPDQRTGQANFFAVDKVILIVP